MTEDDVEAAFGDGETEAEDDGADNAADPKQEKRKARRAARARDEAQTFWREVFATPVGRREMWKILQAGGFDETAFACGPNGFPQPEATWFKAGAKDHVQRLHDGWQVVLFEEVHLMRCENDPRFVKAKRPVTRTDR